MVVLESARLLSCFSMLCYASWRDWKTREVSDLTWLVFGVPGLALDLYELSSGSMGILELAIPVAFSSVLSFILAYLGLFGGADFKAFVVLSVLLPTSPQTIQPLLGIVSVVYPLTLFSNSALAGAFMALVTLVRNLVMSRRNGSLFVDHGSESKLKKLVVLISGQKLKIDAVRGPPFHYPLEEPLGENGAGRQLVIMPNTEDDNAAIEIFQTLKDRGIKEVWVSQTLPFIVFMLFGFISTILIGDMALWLLRWVIFRF